MQGRKTPGGAFWSENGDGENRGFTGRTEQKRFRIRRSRQGETGRAHVKTTVICGPPKYPIATLASGSAAEELMEAVRTYFDGFVNKSGAVTSYFE